MRMRKRMREMCKMLAAPIEISTTEDFVEKAAAAVRPVWSVSRRFSGGEQPMVARALLARYRPSGENIAHHAYCVVRMRTD